MMQEEKEVAQARVQVAKEMKNAREAEKEMQNHVAMAVGSGSNQPRACKASHQI